MKNSRFYHAARELFASLGMPAVTLAEGHAYTIVVDGRIEVRVFASDDEYLRFVAECGPLSSNLSAEQLMALLNCNFAIRPSSVARVGVCPDSGVPTVHGFGRLDRDDAGPVRAAFDDVVALADRVLAIMADPGDGEQSRHQPAVFYGNYT